MEALASGEVNGVCDAEEGDPVERSSICSSTPQRQTADSVIYQLVRVEGDGTLIPATDDEVMEVEHMLEDDKKDLPSIEGSSQFDNSEGNTGKLDGRFEYIEVMLEKVKQQEKLRLSRDATLCSPKYDNVDKRFSDQLVDLPVCNNIPQTESFSHEAASLVPITLNEGSVGYCPDSVEKEQTAGRTLFTGDFSSIHRDFSLLEGEICLDDLTIRELQETFRATFGYQTSVKDKLWLKRRIAMELTNSCDIPSTRFIIKDRKIVMKNPTKGHCIAERTKYEVDSQPAGQNIGSVIDKIQDSPSSCPRSPFQGERSLSGKRLRTSTLENDSKIEDLHIEIIEAKRVRKPTRRYIEELSEVETGECCAQPITPIKSSGLNQYSAKYRFRPASSIGSQHTTFITRKDFLGGCGVQIPYVLRVRRRRPRKNFVALMNADLIQKEKPVAETYSKEHDPVLGKLGASGDYSEDYADIVLRPKYSTRRKHHRAWTLCEVVKLVEGVSKYGAGRWSEIKRLAFPSYTYRTSVDLKDKWRNLLRACFTPRPTEKGGLNSRRHTSVPIPAPILLRVRELAEMQEQEGIGMGSGKIIGHNGRHLQTRPGFL
uniref:Telomere repeat-binding protein 6 n=1 Tax=Anthurium amnicola TaxID=1678845 RepID=A0A1D1XQE9_9ARAE